MTVEQQVRAFFNIPENKILTPIGVTIEYESMMARLNIKIRELEKLYSTYMDTVEKDVLLEKGKTVCALTKISELGFAEKCVKSFEKHGITRLGDVRKVNRKTLEVEKYIGADNVTRLDRIIAPLDLHYSSETNYQETGDDPIDDTVIDENIDKSVKNNLAAMSDAVKSELMDAIKAEIKDEILEELNSSPKPETETIEEEIIPEQESKDENKIVETTEIEPENVEIEPDKAEIESENIEISQEKVEIEPENAEIEPDNVESEAKNEENISDLGAKTDEKPAPKRRRTRKSEVKKAETVEEITFSLDGDLDVVPCTDETDKKLGEEDPYEYEKIMPINKPATEVEEEDLEEADPYETNFKMEDADEEDYEEEVDFSPENALTPDDFKDEGENSAEVEMYEMVEESDPENSSEETNEEEDLLPNTPVSSLSRNSIIDDFDEDESDDAGEDSVLSEEYDPALEDAMFDKVKDLIEAEEIKDEKTRRSRKRKETLINDPIFEEETGVVEEIDISDDDDGSPF